MKILSWNIWSENTSLPKVMRFIKTQNADIVCLQEVSTKALKKLKKLPHYTVVHAIDSYYVKSPKRKIPYYLVILSKVSLIQNYSFAVADIQYDSVIAQLFSLEEGIEGQFIDVYFNNKSIRIFNVHFQSFVGPNLRLEQLKKVLDNFHKDNLHIVCGDFNTFGIWHINLFIGWIYNYSWREYFLNEKTLVKVLFKKFNLVNIFNWEVTYPWLNAQLDFILTEKGIKIKKKKIFTETYGSDHRPLLVEIRV